MCGPRGLGRGGAGTADDAVPAVGLVVILSVVASVAAMVAGFVVGEIYTQLSPERGHDGDAESRGCGDYDGDGVAVDFCVYTGGVGGEDYCAHCWGSGSIDGDLCGAECEGGGMRDRGRERRG